MPRALPLVLLSLLAAHPAVADSTPLTLGTSQDWSNTALISADDVWTGVPGIEGFRGDGITGSTGTDPQTLLTPEGAPVLDVNADETDPASFTTGGATEFELTDPVVALAGSGTADAPYLKLYLNTTGQSGIIVSYTLRDVDGSTDDSIQPVALHFRVGSSGDYTNVPTAFVADASSGPSLATLETPVCATLPAAADNQQLVEVRIMTTNAAGNDEAIGVDDINVSTVGCNVPVELQSFGID